MPISGARYRVHTTKSGKQIRLAFKGKKKVVEAKNLKSGATHTPAEFASDARGRAAAHLSKTMKNRGGKR